MRARRVIAGAAGAMVWAQCAWASLPTDREPAVLHAAWAEAGIEPAGLPAAETRPATAPAWTPGGGPDEAALVPTPGSVGLALCATALVLLRRPRHDRRPAPSLHAPALAPAYA